MFYLKDAIGLSCGSLVMHSLRGISTEGFFIEADRRFLQRETMFLYGVERVR